MAELTTRVRSFGPRSRKARIRTLGKPAPPKPEMKTVAPSATSASASAAFAARLSIGIAAYAFQFRSSHGILGHGQAGRQRAGRCTRNLTTLPISPAAGARELDDLAPLLGFLGNQLAEFLGRAADQHAAEIVELRLHPGLGQHRVDLAVELVHDLPGRLSWRAHAVPCGGLVAFERIRRSPAGPEPRPAGWRSSRQDRARGRPGCVRCKTAWWKNRAEPGPRADRSCAGAAPR